MHELINAAADRRSQRDREVSGIYREDDEEDQCKGSNGIDYIFENLASKYYLETLVEGGFIQQGLPNCTCDRRNNSEKYIFPLQSSPKLTFNVFLRLAQILFSSSLFA
jgi:hypothetical protein